MDSWMDAWHRVEIDAEAQLLAAQTSFLACVVDGVRYIAPLGTPSPPDVETETVLAYSAGSACP